MPFGQIGASHNCVRAWKVNQRAEEAPKTRPSSLLFTKRQLRCSGSDVIWQLTVFLAASVRSSLVHELYPPDCLPVDYSFDGCSAATHFFPDACAFGYSDAAIHPDRLAARQCCRNVFCNRWVFHPIQWFPRLKRGKGKNCFPICEFWFDQTSKIEKDPLVSSLLEGLFLWVRLKVSLHVQSFAP